MVAVGDKGTADWANQRPPIRTGTVVVPIAANANSGTATFNYGVTFGAVPAAQATAATSGNVSANAYGETTTSCTVRAYRTDGGTSASAASITVKVMVVGQPNDSYS